MQIGGWCWTNVSLRTHEDDSTYDGWRQEEDFSWTYDLYF